MLLLPSSSRVVLLALLNAGVGVLVVIELGGRDEDLVGPERWDKASRDGWSERATYSCLPSCGTTWARWGTGLPAVSIWDIGILPDGSVVRAATHGRGFWELAVSAPSTFTISGNAGTMR